MMRAVERTECQRGEAAGVAGLVEEVGVVAHKGWQSMLESHGMSLSGLGNTRRSILFRSHNFFH